MARDQVGWVARAGGLLGVGKKGDDGRSLAYAERGSAPDLYSARPRY